MNVYDFLLTKSWRSQTKSHAQFVLREFFNYMKEAYPEVGKDIATSKNISDETEEKLKAVIEEFKTKFKNSK